VTFEKEANFTAMRGGISFSLAEAQFCMVPNFIQANFSEAPRLDNLHIEPIYKGNLELPARWRALKRLAVQSLDHEQELLFFKGELQSQRWTEGNKWPAGFLLNLLYQVISDYGRSAWRPLLIWLGLTILVGSVLFASVSFGWVDAAQACAAGWWDSVMAAVLFSLSFFNLNSTNNFDQFYTCAYGENYTVYVVSILHKLISAALIFLFLLALRNQFRIK
jgi:hypothetical protein